MDFYEVIMTRRSIRDFKPDPVPEDVLARVLDAARIAPSGSNRQPTGFIVIKDRETMRRLVPLCAGQEFAAGAPVLIVCWARNIKYNRGGWMGDYSMLVDAAIAFDHLTLAARAEGLGTCWIGSFDNRGIKEFLGIPEEVEVVALTPLGYPRGSSAFGPPEGRKPLSEIVMDERWQG